MTDHPSVPAWTRSIQTWLPVRSQFVLWGNVRDLYVQRSAGTTALVPLYEMLFRALQPDGFDALIIFDIVDGPSIYPADDKSERVARPYVGFLGEGEGEAPGSLHSLRQLMETIVEQESASGAGRVALVVDYGSRILDRSDQMEDEPREFFAFAEKLSHASVPRAGQAGRWTHNPVVWVTDHDGDLPAWFTARNDMVGLLPVPDPGLSERSLVARQLTGDLGGSGDPGEVAEAFAGLSAGLGLAAMRDVVQIARDRNIAAENIDDAIRAYKLGVDETPWKAPDLKSKIANHGLRGELFGQDAAIDKAVDILVRSVMGLSGAHVSRHSNRPRGVLFLAGPTGVGKTELAKQLSALVFGSGQEPVRFDMSEFSEEHAGARLIGAPPGYVGYDAGGDLTNAVRRKPHSLFLFDEIEKAHWGILDKFLQILDDGRLTDGRGNTVHFNESILVFTSNLGIMKDVRDPQGRVVERVPNVTPDMTHAEVEERILRAIDETFDQDLNRPELRSRFGDNIVVFQFITPEVAELILDKNCRNVIARVFEEHGIVLRISDRARQQLVQICTSDLRRGGRGIGNRVEVALVDPVSRSLFERPVVGGEVEVNSITEHGGRYVAELV